MADRTIGLVALGVVFALGIIAHVSGQRADTMAKTNQATQTSRQAAPPPPTIVPINEQAAQ